MEFQHEEIDKRGAIRAFEDGEALGSIAWVRSGEHTVIVQHTGVLPAARGKGAGSALFDELVSWARETGTRLTVQCRYLRKKFAEHPETHDVLR